MPKEVVFKSQLFAEFGLRPDLTLYNCPTGVGWHGKVQRTADPQQIILVGPRRVEYGLIVGGSDIIGYKSYVIQPEDVGKTVAIFLGPETKAPWGGLTKEQKIFIRNVNDAGGIAGQVKTLEEAHAMFDFTILPDTHFKK